jgi:diguanylate cyclase (GGDEF)-like protein
MALIHYFLEIHPQLESPIVIEMNLFEEARETAYRDELTGLRNFRFFSENLEHEVRRSEQVNQPVSLVMVDLDDFKRFNDRYGHQEGNRALAAIGAILERAVRVIDGVSRFGGEEFGLVLPTTPKTGAQKVGERVRRAIEAHEFACEDGEPCEGLTASLGVATFPGDARTPEELVRNADRALYVAKSKGKNLVEIYRGNRRSFPRRETRLDGSFRTLGDEHPLTTVDLSTGGLKFRTDRELPVGALLDVQVTVPGTPEAIGMAVRVVGCTRADGEVWEVAAQTLEIARHDLGTLSRYLGKLEPAAEPDAEDSGADAG